MSTIVLEDRDRGAQHRDLPLWYRLEIQKNLLHLKFVLELCRSCRRS